LNELIVLENAYIEQFKTIDEDEKGRMIIASELIEKYPDHALLEIWDASIHNLRRRVENYGIEMFNSSIVEESGRKKYKEDGDTLSDRWNEVDDLVLIHGAKKIGILNGKAEKTLEMINWMRNHTSPAHDTEEKISKTDVISLVVLLKNNLFDIEIPDPGISPNSLIKPIKESELTEEQIQMYNEKITRFKNSEIRTTFGFMLDIICNGTEIQYINVKKLFINVWNKSTEELKRMMGNRYHDLLLNNLNTNVNEDAKTRLYEMFILVKGVSYIPDDSKAVIYRKLAKDLAKAKDTSYGWNLEEAASRALAQAGTNIPSIVFEEVYQEILRVWCGNYWGRSSACLILDEFIFKQSATTKIKIAELFLTSSKVQDEMFYQRPKNNAIELLNRIKQELTIQEHISKIDEVVNSLKLLN
jgi:predicted hydrocarbon binding protein